MRYNNYNNSQSYYGYHYQLPTVALEVVIHVSAVTPVAVTYHSSNLCPPEFITLVHLQ